MQGPRRLLHNAVVLPETEEIWRAGAALGAAVAEHRHFAEEVLPALRGKGLTLVGAPIETLGVVPDEHGGVAGDDTEMVPEGDLDVKLREQRQVDPGHSRHLAGHWPRGVNDYIGGDLTTARQ